MVAALLITTPRQVPRSSTNDSALALPDRFLSGLGQRAARIAWRAANASCSSKGLSRAEKAPTSEACIAARKRRADRSQATL